MFNYIEKINGKNTSETKTADFFFQRASFMQDNKKEGNSEIL